MDNKEFKNIFAEIAKINGFHKAFNGWFKESVETIIVLNLQKSYFGNYYDLNIKIYVHGVFGRQYVRSKDLVNDIGDIFRRQPREYNTVFNLEVVMDDDSRRKRLEELFTEFINPYTDKASSRQGLREMDARGEIVLLETVKEQLGFDN
ncbi:MAG TPA: DUF4304 domain-containing protein [Chitinophaga sp.]